MSGGEDDKKYEIVIDDEGNAAGIKTEWEHIEAMHDDDFLDFYNLVFDKLAEGEAKSRLSKEMTRRATAVLARRMRTVPTYTITHTDGKQYRCVQIDGNYVPI